MKLFTKYYTFTFEQYFNQFLCVSGYCNNKVTTFNVVWMFKKKVFLFLKNRSIISEKLKIETQLDFRNLLFILNYFIFSCIIFFAFSCTFDIHVFWMFSGYFLLIRPNYFENNGKHSSKNFCITLNNAKEKFYFKYII